MRVRETIADGKIGRKQVKNEIGSLQPNDTVRKLSDFTSSVCPIGFGLNSLCRCRDMKIYANRNALVFGAFCVQHTANDTSLFVLCECDCVYCLVYTRQTNIPRFHCQLHAKFVAFITRNNTKKNGTQQQHK